MIRPEGDLLHAGSADPYWNESAWFGFAVPERELTGWVYVYHRPNMGFSAGGVALWDPSGAHPWDCRYYDWGTPVPLGAQMFDFDLDSGLSARCVEPLTAYELTYQGDGCALELRWDALAPPQSATRPGAAELPPGSDKWGTGHYNQPGRVVGTVQLGPDRLDVDCLYARDHSWGPRRFTGNPRGDFASVVASPTSGFCVLAAADLARDADPGTGVPDPVRFGWYLRDGELSRLASGARTVLSRDATGCPEQLLIDGVDDLGRALRATGRVRNVLRWPGYPFLFLHWCQVEWELDGVRAIGEEQDYFPLQQARALIRGAAVAAV